MMILSKGDNSNKSRSFEGICTKGSLVQKVYSYVDMLTSLKSYVSHDPTFIWRVEEDIIIVVTSFFVLTRRKMVVAIVNVCVCVCVSRSVRFFLPTSGGFTHIICFYLFIYSLLLCL